MEDELFKKLNLDDKESLQEFLHCPCCQKDYDQPKLLSCLHSFCYQCLETNLTQNGIGPGEAFLCPICKSQCVVPSRGVRAMKSNIFLVTLREFLNGKSLDSDQQCEACESGRVARKKCVQCQDWLCNQCCAMHSKVKMTRDHQLLTATELQSGQYDELIKQSFEPLSCSKHSQPLKLYCRYPSCQVAICLMCKTSGGHEAHDCVQLVEQAEQEAVKMRSLLPGVVELIRDATKKTLDLEAEEKKTMALRKNLHKAINDRAEEVVQKIVEQVQGYAEEVLAKIEEMTKEHRKDVVEEIDNCQNKLQAAISAKNFAEALLSFDRPEELVSMSKEVGNRLRDFQATVDPSPPFWKEPRLNPPLQLDRQLVCQLFGELTFEGELVASQTVASTGTAFSAKWDQDEMECAICDLCLDPQDNIIVVDRDNARVKVFDKQGNLLMLSNEGVLKAPNRVLYLDRSGLILVKDEKSLKLVSPDGSGAGSFGEKNLKQPVGLGGTREGNVVVSDWMTGLVVILDGQNGEKLFSFPALCEAPGYVTSSANGNIILSDWKQHMVKIFDNKGRLLKQYGSGKGSQDGQLDHPYGVCTDKYNHILVADTWNNRVVLISENGKFLKNLVTQKDGLEWPQSVVVDGQGRLITVEQQGLVKIFQYLN